MMAVENLQRKDLTIVEEGEIYQHLGTAYQLSNNNISKLLGIARRRVDFAINAYTKLSSEVQQMVQQWIPGDLLKLCSRLELLQSQIQTLIILIKR